MVSPLSRVVSLPNGVNGWYKGVTNYLPTGMILQEARRRRSRLQTVHVRQLNGLVGMSDHRFFVFKWSNSLTEGWSLCQKRAGWNVGGYFGHCKALGSTHSAHFTKLSSNCPTSSASLSSLSREQKLDTSNHTRFKCTDLGPPVYLLPPSGKPDQTCGLVAFLLAQVFESTGQIIIPYGSKYKYLLRKCFPPQIVP